MNTLHCGRFMLSLERPLVMGIVNVTPDSFSDGGRHARPDQALDHALKLVRDGADILDIGGESTRPDAARVSVQQEMDRVLPLLERLRDIGVPLSLDTRHTAVMQAGLEIGVDLINDVAALEDDGAVALLAGSDAAVCLMHMQGEPQNMQHDPSYQRDVVDEVQAYLAERVAACVAAGIGHERLLVDPGFGFGKTVDHNYALLAHLDRFATIAPVLAGLSRKTMLGAVTGIAEPAARVSASVAGALIAAGRGAAILRVHDVRETCEALAVWRATRAAG